MWNEYLTLARQYEDQETRAKYYDLFQEELAKDPAYAFICYIDANYVADSDIKGISEKTVLGHHRSWHFLEYSGLGNREIKRKMRDAKRLVTVSLCSFERLVMNELLKAEHLVGKLFYSCR